MSVEVVVRFTFYCFAAYYDFIGDCIPKLLKLFIF